jgi:hypothetical protein
MHTTHCVPYGNPVTTAGPNARAVFTAPPVKYIDQLEEEINPGRGRGVLNFVQFTNEEGEPDPDL